MLLGIESKYIAFNKSQETKMRRFLESHGLAGILYFFYMRLYDDGTALTLTTDTEVIINRFKQNVPMVFQPCVDIIKGNKVFDLILFDEKAPDIMHQENELFGHGHTKTLFEFHGDYCDTFQFVTDGAGHKQLQILVNHNSGIRRFARGFLRAHTALIDKGEYCTLPKEMRGVMRRECYRAKIDLYVQEQDKYIQLPHRQLQALILSGCGEQLKEGARIMGISPNTYKGYATRARKKLGISSKQQLTQILIDNASTVGINDVFHL